MAVAVVGEAGDIVWTNREFITSVSGNRECQGENILRFFIPEDGSSDSGGRRHGYCGRRPAVYRVRRAYRRKHRSLFCRRHLL